MNVRAYQDKIVVIAGGASGIGEQLTWLLASFSAKVIVLDRDSVAGRKLDKDVAEVEFNTLDLTKADAVKRSIRHILRKHGRIDYFFNCAGVFLGGEIRDTPIEDWDRISIANLAPVWNATSIVYTAMQQQGHGHIINVASSAGLFPVPAMSLYGATKAAVVSMTLGLRNEARSLGIRVSVVCPTVVKTPLYETALYAGVRRSTVLELIQSRRGLQDPVVTARHIAKKTLRNRGIIHTSSSTYLTALLFRISPAVYGYLAEKVLYKYRKTLRIQGDKVRR